jgi:hypothetical protein
MSEASSMTDLSSMTDDLPSMTDASSMADAQNAARGPTLNRSAGRALMAGMIAAVSGAAAPAVAGGGVLNVPPHSQELAQGANQIQPAIFCGPFGCYIYCYGYYCYGRRGR